MLSPWTIYWILRLDTIISVAHTVGLISAILAIFTLMGVYNGTQWR